MAFNPVVGVVVSGDIRGMLEYWDSQTLELPESPKILFQMKTETDLYDLAKAKTVPCSITMSPIGDAFVVFSRDKQLRYFDFAKGKLKRKYDESVSAYTATTAGQCLNINYLHILSRARVLFSLLLSSYFSLALLHFGNHVRT